MTKGSSRGPASAKGRRHVLPMAVRLETVARHLEDTIEGLKLVEARRFAYDAAKGPAPLAWLQWHLEARPDALSSGESDVPLVVLRLLRLLLDAGYPGIVPPRCRGCGVSTTQLGVQVPGGRLCRRCILCRRAEACSRCGEVRWAARRYPTGPVCAICNNKDRSKWEPCGLCGHLGRVLARRPDASAVGRCCYQKLHPCSVCGNRWVPSEMRAARGIDDAGLVCEKCYRPPTEFCDRCGAPGGLRSMDPSGTLFCRYCAESYVIGNCDTCGEAGQIWRRRQRRPAWHCAPCWPSSKCAQCGRRQITARWPIGCLCQTCYVKVLQDVASCPGCNKRQPLIGLDDSGARICGACAGIDVDYDCAGCGQATYLVADRLCAACLTAKRARALLAGPDGSVRADLQPFLDALVSIDSPRAVLQWIDPNKGPAAGLLAQLAAASAPISHKLLDSLPPSLSLYRIRQTLVHVGVIPERDDDLERVVPWLEALLAEQPTDRAHLLRTYTHWTLLRRARQRATARPGMRRSPAVRRRVLSALGLLTWLADQGVDLSAADQNHIDRWLTNRPTFTRYSAREFLSWARRRGLTGDVAIPKYRATEALASISEDERWEHLKRCLHDEDIPIHVRAAGSLVLLFGLPVSRISTLRTDDLQVEGPRTFLRLGERRLPLPPAVAALLERQRADGFTVSAIQRSSPEPSVWLFPGGLPGRPARDLLYRGLRRHGITHIRLARSAALITLAAELPAPVLAEMLDIHINTALQWATVGQQDWASYLAARIESKDAPR